MIVAIDIAVVFIVAVLRAKHRRAKGAGKVIDVVFPLQGSNVGSSESAAALMAEKAQPSKVVGFAERIWASVMFILGGEEFGSYDLAAVLQRKGHISQLWELSLEGTRNFHTHPAFEAIQVESAVQGPNKLTRQRLSALLTCPHGTTDFSPVSLLRPVPLAADSRLVLP